MNDTIVNIERGYCPEDGSLVPIVRNIIEENQIVARLLWCYWCEILFVLTKDGNDCLMEFTYDKTTKTYKPNNMPNTNKYFKDSWLSQFPDYSEIILITQKFKNQKSRKSIYAKIIDKLFCREKD